MRAALERRLLKRWFGSPGLLWLLWPLEMLYRLVMALRGRASRQSAGDKPPVIVVGNLAVGGSGKTPLVLALVEAAYRAGWKPAVISRGHGGRGPFPLQVQANTDPSACGDEPLLMARRFPGLPIFVAPVRRAAWAAAVEQGVDVVISDDGLQHRALPRRLEIAVVDGRRGLGNGHCLPVGPLRESAARLSCVDFVVRNGGDARIIPEGVDAVEMNLQPSFFRRVSLTSEKLTVSGLVDRVAASGRVAALAGIGDPARFFSTLQALGISCEGRAFPDHHAFSADDLRPFADSVLLMTEKDAVKCTDLVKALGIDAWYLQVDAQLPLDFFARVLSRAELDARG